MATEYKSEDVDLEAWIDEGVSFLQADVTIYRDPGMFKEYGPLMEKIRILENELKPPKEPKRDRGLEEESVGGEQAAEFADESLGDETKSEVQRALDEAREEAQALWEKYEANKEVWTLRRLNEEEVEEMKATLGPLPDQPSGLRSGANSAQKKAYVDRMEKWSVKMTNYADELHLNLLPKAVLKVVVKGKEVPVPSVDGMRRLRTRPGGDAHFKELRDAMTSLTAEGVSIMAPHSEGTGA